jgi:hypothetical protein
LPWRERREPAQCGAGHLAEWCAVGSPERIAAGGGKQGLDADPIGGGGVGADEVGVGEIARRHVDGWWRVGEQGLAEGHRAEEVVEQCPHVPFAARCGEPVVIGRHA